MEGKGCATNAKQAQQNNGPIGNASQNGARAKNQEQQTKPGQNSQGAGCNVKPAGGGCGGCKPNK